MRLILFFYFSVLISQNCIAQSKITELPSELNTSEWQLDLLGNATIADSIPTTLPFSAVQKLNFIDYTIDSVYVKDERCAWLHFPLKNSNQKDTQTLYINFNRRIHFVEFFYSVNGKTDSIKGGQLTDYYKRPLSNDKARIKLSLPPQSISACWLKFNNFSENRAHLFPRLESPKTAQLHHLEAELSIHAYQFADIIYLSLFAVLALLSARLGYKGLDEAYKWYAIYICSLFIFYFRDFENYNNSPVLFFSYFSSWHFKIESTICYIACIAYMVFIQKFLDMKQFYPRLNRQFDFAVKLLLGLMGIDLFVHLMWGITVSFKAFIYIRLLFFLFYFFALFKIAFSTSASLSRFIMLGTFCMLFPGLTSILSMALGGESKLFGLSFFSLYDFPGFKVPMFGTRLGILFEACFFIFGLKWKAKHESDELKKLKTNQYSSKPYPILNSQNTPLSSIEINILPSEQSMQIYTDDIADINKGNVEENSDLVKKGNDERVVKAFDILENEFKNPEFNVNKWAKSVFMSTYHFAEIINDNTKEPPLRHIQRKRLTHARELIETTGMPIAELATASGYADSNYFARIFKKTFNVPPSEWREMHKKSKN